MMKIKIEIEARTKEQLVDELADWLLKIEKMENWRDELSVRITYPYKPQEHS